MALFPLPSRKDGSPPMSNRRRLTFYTFLTLSTPVLLQMVTGATVPSPTEEAMVLLSRPGLQQSRNYHGIVHFDRHGLMRQETLSSEGQASSGDKSRMNVANYPPKDQIPDVSHPQVKAWVAEIDWSKVPKIPVAEGLEDAPHFPKCPPDDQVDRNSCWWSCDGCVQASSDVMTCPGQNDWGLTYDDGPSEATREMMQHLKSNNLSATFFIVGSRVLEYPDILKEQVEQGHHIAMHSKLKTPSSWRKRLRVRIALIIANMAIFSMVSCWFDHFNQRADRGRDPMVREDHSRCHWLDYEVHPSALW